MSAEHDTHLGSTPDHVVLQLVLGLSTRYFLIYRQELCGRVSARVDTTGGTQLCSTCTLVKCVLLHTPQTAPETVSNTEMHFTIHMALHPLLAADPLV